MKLKYFCLYSIIPAFLIFSLSVSGLSFAQNQPASEVKLAGKLFGVDVPAGNYYFAKRAVLSFGAKWRGAPKDEAELEDIVWQELLFSFEAYRQGISAEPEEIDKEIEKLLKAGKVEFEWRIDKEEYQKWVKDNLNMELDVFRNQLEHLVKLEKLRKKTIESFDPAVTEEEAYQKFLNEYNTLMVELRQFDELKEAEDFYNKSIAPVSKKENQMLIWHDLLLSSDAAKRGIKIKDEEIDKHIQRFLYNLDAHFKWKEEPDKFDAWANEQFGVSAEVFKKRIVQLMVVDELRLKILSKEEQEIDSDNKYKEFLKKNKKVAIAYKFFFDAFVNGEKDVLKFSDLGEAKEFYGKIKRTAGFWEDEKRKDPKVFKVPGFVAVDFLLHMWGFKKDDAYKMLETDIGAFYPPAPIYKGYGVFKVLKVRRAEDPDYEKRKEQYFAKVKKIKQYDLYKQWVEDLKQKAEIERYISH